MTVKKRLERLERELGAGVGDPSLCQCGRVVWIRESGPEGEGEPPRVCPVCGKPARPGQEVAWVRPVDARDAELEAQAVYMMRRAEAAGDREPWRCGDPAVRALLRELWDRYKRGAGDAA